MADTTYATLSELRAQAGIPASGSDGILQAYLNVAAELVDSITNSTFTDLNEAVELHSGRRTKGIRLKRRPVQMIGSVSIDGAAIDASLYELTDDGWLVIPDAADVYNPRIMRDEGQFVWPRGTNNIEVVYSHGYEDVPELVNMATRQLAAHLYTQDARRGVQSESMGPVSKTYTRGDVPALVSAMLEKYKQVDFGG